MKDLSKYLNKPKKSKKKTNLVITNEDNIENSSSEDEEMRFNPKPKVQKQEKSMNKESVIESSETTSKQPETQPQSTIYRDLTGRIVDINTVKSKKDTVILNTSEPEPIKPIKSFTINKSDKEYNEAMKSKTSFEDPMRSKTHTKTLEYNQGVNIPNRFGVKAGVMWDGIDRSNGFETLALRNTTQNKSQKKVIEDYDYDFD